MGCLLLLPMIVGLNDWAVLLGYSPVGHICLYTAFLRDNTVVLIDADSLFGYLLNSFVHNTHYCIKKRNF